MFQGLNRDVTELPRGRACRDTDLPTSAGRLVGTAGWWTVAYLVDVERLRKVDNDAADEDGATRVHMESVMSSNLVVRGWRDGGAFLAAWSAAGEGWKADCAYWWTRDREAWADLPRELVTWRTARPPAGWSEASRRS